MFPRSARPSESADESRPRFYGRRRGRRLRPGRRELGESLLPALRVPLDGSDPLDPAALFPFAPREIRLEIGFGAGEHLAHQAGAEPDVGFIGCEVFVNGVAALLARVKTDNLANVRVLDDDARRLFGRLPAASLDRVVAYFPDPWPKTRHHRRRLIQPASLDEFARILKPGGELRFATDHMEYARWTLARLLAHPAFAWTARGPGDWRERPTDSPETRYAARARRLGGRCVYLVFRRVGRSEGGLPRPAPGDI